MRQEIIDNLIEENDSRTMKPTSTFDVQDTIIETIELNFSFCTINLFGQTYSIFSINTVLTFNFSHNS